MNASVNTVLSCSRLVVRAFLNGLYGSSPADQSSNSPGASSLYTSSLVFGKNAASVLEKRDDGTTLRIKNNNTSPKFTAAKCGFAKDLQNGPSTVLDQTVFGDDACFIASHRTADVVGVADGVGGWRTYGIDPSEFARGLMNICADLVRGGQFRPHLPGQLLARAYQQLHFESCERKGPVGSSTACVVVLDRLNNKVHTANLGDSGYLVVREGRVVQRSEEQCHYFNTPFQLSLPPKHFDTQNYLRDSPESAETASFTVLEGDIILVATDGLFDNLPTDLIERQLAKMDFTDLASVQGACNALALEARRLAFDDQFMSPFAKKAQHFGYHHCGGKPDDITVLLAVVTKEEQNRASSKDAARTQKATRAHEQLEVEEKVTRGLAGQDVVKRE